MATLSAFQATGGWSALADGWRWWIGELAALVPERFGRDPDKIARSEIRLTRDSIEIELVAEGVGQLFADPRRIEDLDSEGWSELATLIGTSRARFMLGSPDVYVTSLSLPRAARRRLKSAIALQLSQLAPLDPALLRWGSAITDVGQDRIHVRVATARAERIEELQALCEANGIEPPPIHAATPEGSLELAAGRDGTRSLSGRASRRALVIAALLILSIPLTTILAAKWMTASTQDRIEELSREAAPRLRAEREARRDEALRGALRPLVARPGISATVEELARRLPPSDHASALEQSDNGIFQFTIVAADPDTAEAALSGSRLLPHVAVTDIVPAANGRLAATFRTSPR